MCPAIRMRPLRERFDTSLHLPQNPNRPRSSFSPSSFVFTIDNNIGVYLDIFVYISFRSTLMLWPANARVVRRDLPSPRAARGGACPYQLCILTFLLLPAGMGEADSRTSK